jgi:hypothetical protein
MHYGTPVKGFGDVLLCSSCGAMTLADGVCRQCGGKASPAFTTLCGASTGGATSLVAEVSCPRCLARLARVGRRPALLAAVG